MSHFPKYMRTGYYRKGTSILQELKKSFTYNWEWQMAFTVFGLTFLSIPLINRRFESRKALMYQYKTEYTVLRDTELDPTMLAGYNADEVEAAKKRTGLYNDK
ncbi:uncharacterized protein LOC143045569 [Mytilus galloprovincialis]|uniref:Uncharacterized protein n=2 Tax=Mytilus galloprovincialis TaxID=29158 RepID=A0A8B6F658_MYTGA|nr:Hypothetical predicted protein [Mytilus galloprovincialis]